MANKTSSEKNKPTRKTLRPNEYYNPKTKRYEYHYKDCFGKERVISSYRLEMTDQLLKGKKSTKSLREKEAELNAYLKNNIDIDFYTVRERSLDEVFPWDFIDCGVTKTFLKKEWERAMAAEVTPNCRQNCNGCGAARYQGGVCFEN